MNKQLQENNYVIIDNFISAEQAHQLYQTFKQDVLAGQVESVKDTQCPISLNAINYRWFTELLVNKCFSLSEFMEETMLPTYSYSRLYKKGVVLEKHIDRPACEVSITLHLGSDGVPWPIYFTKPDGEVVSVELKTGQAAIYLGMESEHWRDEYQGDDYVQVFLHYVKARGKHWDQYFDIERQIKYAIEKGR
jgi:hypothetical protein